MPSRIQRSRAKGWRMPEGAIYVGRPTRWGNPFVAFTLPNGQLRINVGNSWGHLWPGIAPNVAVAYRLWLTGRLVQCEPHALMRQWRTTIVRDLPALRGHDLCCWCDQPCHADVLLELANG